MIHPSLTDQLGAPGSIRSARVLLLVAALLAPGCAGDADEDAADDDDEGIARSSSELSAPGAWRPPSSVLAAGATQFVSYTGAGPWRGAAGCGGSLLAGTRQLADSIRAQFPESVRSYGGYSCRPNTANTSQTSVHGTGRAVDLFVPLSGGQADNTKGDAVANWLVRNAASIGVQYIIWDRASWQASLTGDKLRGYSGPHPHHDHIHLELSPDGAARRTAFFAGSTPLPPGDPAPAPEACAVRADGKLHCTNRGGAPLRSAPSAGASIVNTLRTTESWFTCWGTGEHHAGGNTTWYFTLGDDNASWGWLPGVMLDTPDAFDADPSARGLKACAGPPPPPPTGSPGCRVEADGKLHCTNRANAPLRSAPGGGAGVVNTLRTTNSWFSCWGTGELHAGGNTTWYYTLGDDNARWGWIPGVMLNTPDAFDADPTRHGLRACR
jgi:hypothetical protein